MGRGIEARTIPGLLAGCSLAVSCSLTSLEGLSGGKAGDASPTDGGVPSSALTDGATGGPVSDPDAGSGAGARLRAAILADRPAGYWRFEETAGPKFKDEVAGNDATASGNCSAGAPGVGATGGRAIELDGQTCMLDVGGGFDFASRAPFTIEMWLSRRGNNFYHLFTRQVRSGENPVHGYALVISENGGLYFERVANGAIRATQSVNVPNNQFVHVAAAFDGNRMDLYVDGTLRQSRTDTTVIPAISARALIGAKSNGGWFSGVLDELAVYDQALNVTQIAAHHQAASAP